MNLMLPLTLKKYFLNITQQNKIFSLQTIGGRRREHIYIFTKILSNEKLVLLSDFAIFSCMNGNIISEGRVGGEKS